MTTKRKLTILGSLLSVAAAVAIVLGVLHETSGGPRPSITIQPTVSVVPSKQAVRITHMTTGGELICRYMVDPHGRRCVQEIAANACPPFSALLVFDDSGRSSLNGLTLEVRETPVSDTAATDDYQEVIAELDTLAGQTLEREGLKDVDGRSTWVVKSHKDVRGDEGERALYVTGYVDPSTGLVVREEVCDGSRTFVVVRELGDASTWQYGETDRSSLATLAKNIRKERIEMVSQLPWETFALPESEDGLSLMWLAPSVDSSYCRLEYESVRAPGEGAVSVVLRDLKTNPDYPSELLNALEDAVVDDSGDFQRVSFRLGDTGIQVLVVKKYTGLSAKEWAGRLVPLSDAGLM